METPNDKQMKLSTFGNTNQTRAGKIESLIDAGHIASANYYATIESTNSAALHDLRAQNIVDSDLPRLYVTDLQTAGRGRHGRTWISPSGALAFSLVVDVSDHQQKTRLSLLVGVAVAQAIEHVAAPLKCQLKWPNDVYIGGCKAAGILLESNPAKPSVVVIGVGINVNDAPTLDSSVVQSMATPTSVADATGRQTDPFDLLGNLIERFQELRDEPWLDTIKEFQKRCYLTGKSIRFSENNITQIAHCLGINAAGELQIQSGKEFKNLCAGEVQLVRVT